MNKDNPNDTRPVPDPTALTTQQLFREVDGLERSINHLRELQEEKFAGIQVQFRERDERTEQRAVDSKAALDAALAAAEKAVGKSEASTIKQIDQQTIMFQTSTAGQDKQINDLKDRVTRMEAAGSGKMEAKVSHQATGNYVIAIVGAIVGIAGIIIAVLARRVL